MRGRRGCAQRGGCADDSPPKKICPSTAVSTAGMDVLRTVPGAVHTLLKPLWTALLHGRADDPYGARSNRPPVVTGTALQGEGGVEPQAAGGRLHARAWTEASTLDPALVCGLTRR